MEKFGKYTQAMSSSTKLLGAKEIEQMFADLPKQLSRYTVWKALWREVGKPALKDAQNLAPKL